MSATLLLDSSQSDKDSAHFYVMYIPPIELNRAKQYEIRLISCTCCNAMANVKSGINDEFIFSTFEDQFLPPSTSGFAERKWIKLKIPHGAYYITDLKKAIKTYNKRGR